ncbi:serine hydrolase [Maribacter sp. ACAM166]|uniref:serine hydrolase n=1 Tax=Maribacter sp. ACAM166 TaxID=2508996 RepID=UPI0010FE4D52|nr:serine hydrolase [Maribacter sp. ACAM166]TLP76763.1 serine hydrolase [Maribacter sp. ACAM166]
MKQIILFFYGVFLLSCSQHQPDLNPLEMVLSSDNSKIKKVMDSVDRYQVQIRYTQIDRKNDTIIFTDYDFQVNDSMYFYPASTVKFPTAVLALERLNQTDTLSLQTNYYIEGDTIESTVARDLSEIFAISDNLANNRLVELLGQDVINATLKNKGIAPVRIAHRLGSHLDSFKTKPLILYLNDSTTGITTPTINTPPIELKLNQIKKGTGYFKDDVLIKDPFDFSLKNYYPISSQHTLLKRVIFPQNFELWERFDISDNQRQHLLTTMHTVPQKVGYDSKTYYDGYCKFFLYGDTKKDIPVHIEIYNKVGFAYGTLTDCAYIKDTKNDIDFLLTATILVNKDGIFNDDVYEYDEIGIPFLAQLGREIYQQELKRK